MFVHAIHLMFAWCGTPHIGKWTSSWEPWLWPCSTMTRRFNAQFFSQVTCIRAKRKPRRACTKWNYWIGKGRQVCAFFHQIPPTNAKIVNLSEHASVGSFVCDFCAAKSCRALAMWSEIASARRSSAGRLTQSLSSSSCPKLCPTRRKSHWRPKRLTARLVWSVEALLWSSLWLGCFDSFHLAYLAYLVKTLVT